MQTINIIRYTAGKHIIRLLCVFIGLIPHTGNAGTENNITEILQPTRDRMPLTGTRAMIQDREGYIWYGTVEGGICRDNGYQIDVFRNDRSNPRRIGQSNGILSICEDGNGNIIFGTRKNIFVLDKKDYSIRQIDKSLPDGRVTELRCGSDGTIFATTENGSYIFGIDYRLIRKTASGQAAYTEATCKFTDRYGNEWSGGPNMENRIRINDRRGIEKHDAIQYPEMLTDIRRDFIEADDGYIGHNNTEVFWTETIEVRPKNWHRLLSIGTRISCVAVSKGGWLYIGDSHGLYRIRYKEGRTEGQAETVSDTLGNIRKMAAAPEGGIYFITPHCELAYCDDNGKITVLQQGTESSSLAVSGGGTVWTTDWLGNIFRYDRKSRRLVNVPDAGIESGDPVNAMTCDNRGNLWLITDKMIKEYTTGGQWRTVHSSDLYVGTSQFLHIYNKAGHITVTSPDALLVIDPAFRSHTAHRLALTTACIDGRMIYSFHDNTVTIPCDASIVELFFSTFYHVNAGSVRYIYRIDGGAWQHPDAGGNNITFVNLHKGRYNIEVRATDADGFCRDETLHIRLDRKPAWWETTWAYIIYIILTVTAIVSADRMWQRYKATRRKVAELQARLDEYLRKDDAAIDKVAEQITDNGADREFIERAVAVVEANMDDSGLGIDTLCTGMAMSRSSLYRKFADITGQKPTEFIRSIRLKRAAEIIREGGRTISETAYLCGFSSPSYFNRRFKEMFGVSPTEYR